MEAELLTQEVLVPLWNWSQPESFCFTWIIMSTFPLISKDVSTWLRPYISGKACAFPIIQNICLCASSSATNNSRCVLSGISRVRVLYRLQIPRGQEIWLFFLYCTATTQILHTKTYIFARKFSLFFFFFLISFKVSGFVIILGRQIITALIYHWGNCDSFIHLFSHSTEIDGGPLTRQAGDPAVN